MGTHQQRKSSSLAPFLTLCFSKDLCITMVKSSHQFPRTTSVVSYGETNFQWTGADWKLLWNNSDWMRNLSIEEIQLSGFAICWCYHGVTAQNWKDSYLEQWLLFFLFSCLFLVACYFFFRAPGVCSHQDFIKLSKTCLCSSILIVICSGGIMQQIRYKPHTMSLQHLGTCYNTWEVSIRGVFPNT